MSLKKPSPSTGTCLIHVGISIVSPRPPPPLFWSDVNGFPIVLVSLMYPDEEGVVGLRGFIPFPFEFWSQELKIDETKQNYKIRKAKEIYKFNWYTLLF